MIEAGALALRARMDAGELTAQDLMAETLARIDAVNGSVNAIVALRDADTLMAEARAADAQPAKGWLHGIPIAVKDLAHAAGLPTSMGSPLFAGQVAAADDIAVARMRAAGAIVIGKTNTPEFGLGSHSYNPVFGATRNPYELTRSAGGSSGGAGVALATGMLSVADGSDMMGSLRNPAAWNNVYGMRPSWGLVPSEPAGDSFLHQLATNGPMARNPRDLAALLDTMAGPDPRQPHGLTQATALDQMDQPIGALRLGWLADWGGALRMDTGVLDLCAGALTEMEGMGMQVDALAAPFDRDTIWQSWITLRSWAVAGGLAPIYADPAQRDALKPAAIWEIERGLALSATDVHKASVDRTAWFQTAAQLFERYDVLALPSAQMWPFDVTLDWPREIAGHAMDTYHRWMEVVIAASLLGLPVVNIPVGFGGPDDLPMGLQLIGKRGSDAMLLRLADRWHTETNWPSQRPPQVNQVENQQP
ncbi:amidase [uncultured Tateyamaria sp.]|uniref:amidase n=1 Tax=uncultured Tateyamaria sp. TaxID=455651 RepID=UPI002628F15D|nr:amidase [uncultured Tateyamaria sp.]